MDFSKFSIQFIKNILQNKFLEEAQKKALLLLANIKKSKKTKVKQSNFKSAVQLAEPKSLNCESFTRNGEIKVINEEHIAEVMEVLRVTNTAISQDNFKERHDLKMEKIGIKKFSNQKALEQVLKKDVAKPNRLRSRIKKMRKMRAFPLPQTLVSNYRKKFGLLKLNSIKID